MPSHWTSQLALLGALLGAALLLGLGFGGTAWWVAAALASYLARTLWRVYALHRFLTHEESEVRFPSRGLWAEMFTHVNRDKTKARGRKRRYHKLLRQVRESTDALADGGVILNVRNEIRWFNPAATRLLGLDPSIDIGNRLDNLIRHPDFVRYLERPAGEGVTIPSPLQEDAWLAVQVIPYGRDQRLAIVRDVTRPVRLERTRRDFVANASHELRSPITVISGYLDTLAEDEELPATWQAPIGEMQRQAQRMSRILSDLIELARLETAERASPSRVDVPALLRALHEELARTGREPKVDLEIDTEAALLGHESEVYSIVRNLVENAVRFTPVSGKVTVRWGEDPGGGASLEVIDTGIGIPPEQIPRITERFYRVDAGRSRVTGGTGLGLAIVKHALQLHDGTLAIESREGEGSKFSCHFPARRLLRGEALAQPVV